MRSPSSVSVNVGRLPADERPQRRVGVDERALDRTAPRWRSGWRRSRSRSSRCRGSAGRWPRRRRSRGSRRRRAPPPPPRTSSGMPSTRAKSLPRPPGITPIGRPGAGERAADLADQPVAADHDGDLAARGRRAGLAAAVLEALVVSTARCSSPAARHRGLDPRQQLQRPAAAGRGVEQQQEAACARTSAATSPERGRRRRSRRRALAALEPLDPMAAKAPREHRRRA